MSVGLRSFTRYPPAGGFLYTVHRCMLAEVIALLQGLPSVPAVPLRYHV